MKKYKKLLSLLLMMTLILLALIAGSLLASAETVIGWPESDHPYANNMNKTWNCVASCDGDVIAIDVTFSSDTEFESRYDNFYIYDAHGNSVGSYTGTSLAGKTVRIPGTSFSLRLTTDGSVTRYGFRIVSVEAVPCEHQDADGDKLCDVCGKNLDYPESAHPYGNSIDTSWTYTYAGPADPASLAITFSGDTCFESGYDKLYVYDADGNQVGSYTASALAGQTIVVNGSSFRLRLVTDGSVTAYGFRITDIEPLCSPSGRCGDSLTWSFSSLTGALTISGSGAMYDYDAETAPWYAYAQDITSVSISDSATSIGSYAFYGCAGLTSVTIPASVTSIGSYAFSGCTALTRINWNAANVSDLTTSSKVFFNAGTSGDGIEVIFGDTVESIPAYLFYVSGSSYSPMITSVTIGESVTSIGSCAFGNCTALTRINWNAENASDFTSSFNVFYNAGTSGDGIEVIFGDTVESIPAYLFYIVESSYSPKITSVTIGDSVTSIGSYAFYHCSGLTSVTIPASVTSIGSYAFSGCTALTKINWNAANVSDLTNSSYVFYNAGTSGDGIEVIFGDTVESIPAYLFYISDSSYSSKITSVTIGESVTSIGSYAFGFCTALTRINWNAAYVGDLTDSSNVFYNAGTSGNGIEVIFGDTVESIPANLFYLSSSYSSSYRPKITSVTIGDSVTNIGSYAFFYCTGLTSVTFPESVTSIGSDAFYGCSSLQDIYFRNPNSLSSSDSSYTIPSQAIIHSHAGYSVEAYAKNNGRTFVAMHNPVGDWLTTEATCGENGVRYHACQYCDEKQDVEIIEYATGNHSYTSKVTTPATCAATGVRTYTCSVCGDSYTTTIAKDSSNHTGGTEVRNAKSATCGANGYTGDTYCKGCGVKLSSGSTIYATGNHSYTSKVTTPATCAATGIRTYTCSGCGDTYTTTVAKDSSNHTGGTEVRNAKSATCGANGYTGDTYCKGCGVKLSSGSTIYATGNHSYTSKVTTPATCAATGIRTYTCSGCDYTYTEIIAKDYSNHTGGTEIRYASSTYTGDTYCLGCGALLEEGEYIAPCDHEYTLVSTIPATCHEYGAKEYECLLCGDIYTESIAKDYFNHTGGTETRNAISATCGEDGYSGDTYCLGCGMRLRTGFVIPPTLTHDYTSVVTKEATCSAYGEKVYTCSVCGDSFSDSIPKDASNHTGVTEVKNAKNATCGEDGYTGDICCKGCGAKFSSGSVLPATGNHSYADKVTTEATCIDNGVRTYTCSVCGDVYRETIAKNPVNHVGGSEVRNAKNATCLEDGYTGDTYCKGCGVKLSSGSTVAAKGHTEELLPGKPSTCTETGLTEGKRCSVCGEVLVEQEVLLTSGHHFCDWMVSKPATFRTAGTSWRVCSACGYKETQELPTLSPEHETRDAETGIAVLYNDTAYAGDVSLHIEILKSGDEYKVVREKKGNYRNQVFSLTTQMNGQNAEPNESVLIELPVPARFSDEKLCVYRVNEDGTLEKAETFTDHGALFAEIGSTGVYALVDESEEVPPYEQGDLDEDGVVTAADARLALRIAASLEAVDGEMQFLAADVDEDGSVTATDARKILRVAAQIDTF